MLDRTFNYELWASVPFGFWALCFFVFGAITGSFLNVCIYRMPRDESVISPPSHCPHCGYSIPWWLNIPLITWLWLRAKCANCGAAISARYFLVELLTALLFLGCWLAAGSRLDPFPTLPLGLVWCVFTAGLVTATFIDFEHFIIPDEITFGGMAAGFFASFAVPALHGAVTRAAAMQASFWGMVAGGGIVYSVLMLGKLLFGRQRFKLPPDSQVIFTEDALQMPEREIPFDEIFYRKRDSIRLHAKTARVFFRDPAPDAANPREFTDVPLQLRMDSLQIGDEAFEPEQVTRMECVSEHVTASREAMGFGDVKFMAAIGAFIGWQGAVFSLIASSILGSVVAVFLVASRRKEWSSRIPYGPYIALAALLWVLLGMRKLLAGLL